MSFTVTILESESPGERTVISPLYFVRFSEVESKRGLLGRVTGYYRKKVRTTLLFVRSQEMYVTHIPERSIGDSPEYGSSLKPLTLPHPLYRKYKKVEEPMKRGTFFICRLKKFSSILDDNKKFESLRDEILK